jgi:hypothetical protein
VNELAEKVKSEHIVAINLDVDGKENIGTIDMLDGDGGKTYSLPIFNADQRNRDDLYFMPYKANYPRRTRDIQYLDEILSPEVYGRVQQSIFDLKEADSLVLHDTDLKISKSQLVENERFGEWIERDQQSSFSDKEYDLYKEMVESGFPKLEPLEEIRIKKEQGEEIDFSLDDGERLLKNYVDKINEKQPMVESRTDNNLRPRYGLGSVDKDHDINVLTMKYHDRTDFGFKHKTLSFDKGTGIVSEYNINAVSDSQNMIISDKTLIREFDIKDLSEKHIDKNKEHEKTITRITQTEALERQ